MSRSSQTPWSVTMDPWRGCVRSSTQWRHGMSSDVTTWVVTSRHEFRGNSWSATLKFASWTYDTTLVDLQPLPRTSILSRRPATIFTDLQQISEISFVSGSSTYIFIYIVYSKNFWCPRACNKFLRPPAASSQQRRSSTRAVCVQQRDRQRASAHGHEQLRTERLVGSTREPRSSRGK